MANKERVQKMIDFILMKITRAKNIPLSSPYLHRQFSPLRERIIDKARLQQELGHHSSQEFQVIKQKLSRVF